MIWIQFFWSKTHNLFSFLFCLLRFAYNNRPFGWKFPPQQSLHSHSIDPWPAPFDVYKLLYLFLLVDLATWFWFFLFCLRSSRILITLVIVLISSYVRQNCQAHCSNPGEGCTDLSLRSCCSLTSRVGVLGLRAMLLNRNRNNNSIRPLIWGAWVRIGERLSNKRYSTQLSYSGNLTLWLTYAALSLLGFLVS